MTSIDLGFKAGDNHRPAVFGKMQTPISDLGVIFGEFETDFKQWQAFGGLRIRW